VRRSSPFSPRCFFKIAVRCFPRLRNILSGCSSQNTEPRAVPEAAHSHTGAAPFLDRSSFSKVAAQALSIYSVTRIEICSIGRLEHMPKWPWLPSHTPGSRLGERSRCATPLCRDRCQVSVLRRSVSLQIGPAVLSLGWSFIEQTLRFSMQPARRLGPGVQVV
jgi:hypothetical protein